MKLKPTKSYIKKATITSIIKGVACPKETTVAIHPSGITITPIGECHSKVLPEEWPIISEFINTHILKTKGKENV